MLQEVHLISDLGLLLLLLRNHTDRPFIVGDSPSVFVNNYMRKVTDFGVLGLGCTGLMISMPLDPRTAILFFDPTVYSVPTAVRDCVDITDVGDVSSLNAVQLHACEENIYFEDQVFQQYVADLIKAHQPLLVTARGNFLVHKPGELLLDGKPTTNDILHTFEPQLPVSLNLGCVETAEWRGHDFGTKGRKAARLRDFNRRPGRHRRISASTLAAELGPQIEF